MARAEAGQLPGWCASAGGARAARAAGPPPAAPSCPCSVPATHLKPRRHASHKRLFAAAAQQKKPPGALNQGTVLGGEGYAEEVEEGEEGFSVGGTVALQQCFRAQQAPVLVPTIRS
eukprot:3874113-Rhodomonas_salina.1